MTVLSQRREVGEFRRRYKWMALFALLAFGLLAVRAIQLQVFDHEHYAAIAQENITKTITLPASRGILRDTQGRLLATNETSYNVHVTPQLVRGERDLRRLAALLGLTDEDRDALAAKIAAVPPRRRAQPIEMLTGVSREQMAAVETHGDELPSVDVVAVPVRRYPFGPLGAHAVGYMAEVNADDLAAREGRDYRVGEFLGRTGVEEAWESYLRGRRGFRRVLVDARGRPQERAAARGVELGARDPSPGRDVVLALDVELLRIIDRAFAGHPSGAAVVVDPRTGRVRALYSKPAYDPNTMSGHLTQAQFEELQHDPFRPLIDKTLYESYYPGSTFKPVSALASLSHGLIDPSARVECLGYHEIGNRRFRCTQPHGDVDLRHSLVQSCNVYYWKLAEQVGLDRLAAMAGEFGFGERTGIGINSESPGFIPTREWYERQQGERFRVGFTLNTAIGQGSTRVTLLQLAMMYAAIANGGTLYVPQLVERLADPSGASVEDFEPTVRRRVGVSTEHLALVVDGLYGVVNDPSGTAYDARILDGVPIAGKTGTAQVPQVTAEAAGTAERAAYLSRDHAWFAGFAPAGDPRAVVVVLVEHGGAGGKTAAPIGVRVLQDYLAAALELPSEADAAGGGLDGPGP